MSGISTFALDAMRGPELIEQCIKVIHGSGSEDTDGHDAILSRPAIQGPLPNIERVARLLQVAIRPRSGIPL